jgi:hypothetical protein
MAKTIGRDLADFEKDLNQLRKKIEDPRESSFLVFQCGRCGTFFWKKELWYDEELDVLFYQSFHRPGLRGFTVLCQSDECDEEFLIEPLNAREHLDWLERQVRARSIRPS